MTILIINYKKRVSENVRILELNLEKIETREYMTNNRT